jgi:ribose 5-phosphate isomerase RpiB
MKIFIGADHRGFTLKQSLKPWLTEQGVEVVDLGAPEHIDGDD